jgi:hypothetical protein
VHSERALEFGNKSKAEFIWLGTTWKVHLNIFLGFVETSLLIEAAKSKCAVS